MQAYPVQRKQEQSRQHQSGELWCPGASNPPNRCRMSAASATRVLCRGKNFLSGKLSFWGPWWDYVEPPTRRDETGNSYYMLCVRTRWNRINVLLVRSVFSFYFMKQFCFYVVPALRVDLLIFTICRRSEGRL